jgi:hypothetical protein
MFFFSNSRQCKTNASLKKLTADVTIRSPEIEKINMSTQRCRLNDVRGCATNQFCCQHSALQIEKQTSLKKFVENEKERMKINFVFFGIFTLQFSDE